MVIKEAKCKCGNYMKDTTKYEGFWTSNRLSDKKFISHIKYEKDKGANFYVAKYLDKNIEYDYIWKN